MAKDKWKEVVENTGLQPADDTPDDDIVLDKTSENKEEEFDISVERGGYSHYTYLGNNKYLPLNETKTQKTLPSGLYSIYHSHIDNAYVFQRQKFLTDKVYQLPIEELKLINEDISKFWKTEPKFRKYGLVHKRGILLYGKPGCGKSCAIQLVMKDLIENHNGLIFKISNHNELDVFLSQFNIVIRTIEPDRKVVVILEDIDGLFQHDSSIQTKLLNLLDGINQNSNIVYIGTTNYPERLEERLLNRPSRFDKRYEFRLPNADIRESYLTNALKSDDLINIDLQEWVDESEGLTLSHLRELIVSVIILENDFNTEINTLKDMGTVISSASYRTTGVTGFKTSKVGGGVGFYQNQNKNKLPLK